MGGIGDTAAGSGSRSRSGSRSASGSGSSSASGLSSRRLRIVLGAAGGLVFLLGLLTVLAPSGAASPLRAVVSALGNDYLAVAVLGALALLLGLGVLFTRVRSGMDQARPPPPERVYPVARHGESIDVYLTDGGEPEHHESVRNRLRSIAVTTVMRAENCSKAEATERVETGEWTDEERAATFLSASPDQPGLGARLKAAVTGTVPHRAAARATAEALADLDAEARR